MGDRNLFRSPEGHGYSVEVVVDILVREVDIGEVQQASVVVAKGEQASLAASWRTNE